MAPGRGSPPGEILQRGGPRPPAGKTPAVGGIPPERSGGRDSSPRRGTDFRKPLPGKGVAGKTLLRPVFRDRRNPLQGGRGGAPPPKRAPPRPPESPGGGKIPSPRGAPSPKFGDPWGPKPRGPEGRNPPVNLGPLPPQFPPGGQARPGGVNRHPKPGPKTPWPGPPPPPGGKHGPPQRGKSPLGGKCPVSNASGKEPPRQPPGPLGPPLGADRPHWAPGGPRGGPKNNGPRGGPPRKKTLSPAPRETPSPPPRNSPGPGGLRGLPPRGGKAPGAHSPSPGAPWAPNPGEADGPRQTPPWPKFRPLLNVPPLGSPGPVSDLPVSWSFEGLFAQPPPSAALTASSARAPQPNSSKPLPQKGGWGEKRGGGAGAPPKKILGSRNQRGAPADSAGRPGFEQDHFPISTLGNVRTPGASNPPGGQFGVGPSRGPPAGPGPRPGPPGAPRLGGGLGSRPETFPGGFRENPRQPWRFAGGPEVWAPPPASQPPGVGRPKRRGGPGPLAPGFSETGGGAPRPQGKAGFCPPPPGVGGGPARARGPRAPPFKKLLGGLGPRLGFGETPPPGAKPYSGISHGVPAGPGFGGPRASPPRPIPEAAGAPSGSRGPHLNYADPPGASRPPLDFWGAISPRPLAKNPPAFGNFWVPRAPGLKQPPRAPGPPPPKWAARGAPPLKGPIGPPPRLRPATQNPGFLGGRPPPL
ncbi:unnamed protein product [Arctia plantaginis]|uniref:Uncharacterized protein n=1 Tax=Arctia plantaginis TaxID=874455 RepID=A0A8S1BLP9_ARCPL|nr:unnamed protein product [Arctia plantaginis]